MFSAAVTRVPFDQFHRVQVSDVRVPEHGATKCRRRWDFFGGPGPAGLSIWVECWTESDWAGPEADFVHQLAMKLGWPLVSWGPA